MRFTVFVSGALMLHIASLLLKADTTSGAGSTCEMGAVFTARMSCACSAGEDPAALLGCVSDKSSAVPLAAHYARFLHLPPTPDDCRTHL